MEGGRIEEERGRMGRERRLERERRREKGGRKEGRRS